MNFDKYSQVTTITIKIKNISIASKTFLKFLYNQSSPPAKQPLTFFPCSFAFSGLSYKWNSSVCRLFSVASYHSAFEIHACCVYQWLFLFYH